MTSKNTSPNCAVLDSITSPANFKIINVLSVLNDIKTEKYKALIDALPCAKTDKTAYTEAKRHLPAWALNGEFSGKVINSGFIESNGLFHIDIDNLENPALIKHQLAREIPEIYALWLSPSGHGLKGLLRIPDDLIHDDTDFKKAFEQINEFLSIYDIEIDKACKDVRRLCFVSSDSDIYINEAAPAFMFDSVKWDYKPTVSHAAPAIQSNRNYSDRYIKRCCDVILNAGTGNYHNARLRAGKLAGGFIAAGYVNEHNIMQALSDASDAISAQSGDKQDVIEREQKTIYDAIQHGKAQPVEQHNKQQKSFALDSIQYQQNALKNDDSALKSNEKLFTKVSDLLANPTLISWIIRDYLPTESTCCIYGASGAGKSFLMLDMSLHVATAQKAWQGHKTRGGAVFYIAGEGQIGLTARCKAWSLHHNISLDNALFYCSDSAIKPQNAEESARLISEITDWIKSTKAKPALIVFDTLARCFIGEENSSTDSSHYIDSIDALKKAFKCCVVSVHHTGKDTTRGGRGSSVFKGAWDYEHELSLEVKNIDIKVLKTTKAKDSKPAFDKSFALKTVNTGWYDEDDIEVSSAVIISTTAVAHTVKDTLSKRTNDVLDCLKDALDSDSIAVNDSIKVYLDNDAPPRFVHIDAWKKRAFTVISANESKDFNKSKAFSDCQKQLIKAKKIAKYDNYCWII